MATTMPIVDYKGAIIAALDIMKKKEIADKQKFKVAAYSKVIKQIDELPYVRSMDDLKDVKGIGEKIRDKVIEIMATGTLRSAERAREEKQLDVYDTLMRIHGVGPAKAKQLINSGIKNIASLRSAVEVNPGILSNIQKAGLKYYEDIHERIPREEIALHEEIMGLAFRSAGIESTIVGSYRRGLTSSGDIDILVTGEQRNFVAGLIKLHKENYIVETLAEGITKGLYIVRLTPTSKARRVDILYTKPEEYPYAVLYFTGSKEFNVAMRKWALDRGYSLNEHGLTNMSTGEQVEGLASEKNVFDFLGMKYVSPTERKDGSAVAAAAAAEPASRTAPKIIRIGIDTQNQLKTYRSPVGKQVKNTGTIYYFKATNGAATAATSAGTYLKITLSAADRTLTSTITSGAIPTELAPFNEADMRRFMQFIGQGA